MANDDPNTHRDPEPIGSPDPAGWMSFTIGFAAGLCTGIGLTLAILALIAR